MNKPKDKKSTKAPSDFDFCPTHKVFYASCKCLRKQKKEIPSEVVPLPLFEDNNNES